MDSKCRTHLSKLSKSRLGYRRGRDGVVQQLFAADWSPGSVVAVAGCLVRCSFLVIEVIFDVKPNDTEKNI